MKINFLALTLIAVVSAQTTIQPVTDRSICLAAAQDKDGARVTLAPCDNPVATVPFGSILWGNPSDRLTTFGGNKCLDNTDSGNNSVQVWTCVDGNTNQMWGVVFLGERIDGNFTMVWNDSNKCLGVRDGKPIVGADLEIRDCDNSPRQIWAAFIEG